MFWDIGLEVLGLRDRHTALAFGIVEYLRPQKDPLP